MTGSKLYPYITWHCLKKIIKVNFSTSTPQSNAKNFIWQLSLKILILLLTTLPHKEFNGPLTWPKVAKLVENFVPCEKKSKYYVNFLGNYVTKTFFLIINLISICVSYNYINKCPSKFRWTLIFNWKHDIGSCPT